jgi:hypothetical protein
MAPRSLLPHGGRAVAERTVGQIEAYVRHRLAGRVRDFRVLIRDRGLVLRGRAPTYYVKQLAQHAVMERVGLPILANEIEVS